VPPGGGKVTIIVIPGGDSALLQGLFKHPKKLLKWRAEFMDRPDELG
jgi:hypothetical protein|tara:strand:+ start:58 stop:198 length:141 start_codon:yes stop_codon:yes gene_type:complete